MLATLVVAAFVAGAIDAIAGGGGLVTVPVLLAAGLPPHLALGTNKGQSVFGAATAVWRYAHAGLIDVRQAAATFPAGFAGALAGAALLLWLDPSVLRPIILVLLVVAGFVVAFRRVPSEEARAPRRYARVVAAVFSLGIGAYDGFFGPGTGTFLFLAFVGLLHVSVPRATAAAKVVNFASNLAAVLLLAARGAVVWKIALPMAGAQFLGALVGAHLAIKGGERTIRRVVLVVVLGLVVRLGYDLLAS
ncbi:MAG: TSUP family transporter [Myxococcota bacterium]